MPRRWRSPSRKARGIAEIVGTLMLILIVIAASIALAAFVASYQKQLQAEEAQSQQRSLEQLKILSVTPVLDPSNSSRWANFSFVLASEYINPSVVNSISLNGQPLKVYWVSNLSSSFVTPVAYSSSVPFSLAPRAEVVIAVNLTAPGGDFTWFSSYDTSFVLTTTDYIELSVYTALQNTFTQVFVPPTAIAVVSSLTTLTDGSYETVPVLDGSNSFQPGNGTVVAWDWNVTNTTALVSTSNTLSGGVTISSGSNPETGSATFDVPYGFLTGTALALDVVYSDGSGTGEVVPGSLAITGQTTPSGTPSATTVSFSFTYSATAAGTITINSNGASLWANTSARYGPVTSTGAPTLTSGSVSQGFNEVTGSATFAEPLQYVSATALALTLTGGSATGTVISGPTITSVAVGGGTVDVEFSFGYIATTAGTIVASGATLLYAMVTTATFSGEKVEPVYWMTASAGTIYDVVLTVVNSDDLFGVAQITYTAP